MLYQLFAMMLLYLKNQFKLARTATELGLVEA
jgi:hypothetical protein